MLGFDVINNWDTELKDMNKDKVGLGTISLSRYFSSLAWLCNITKYKYTNYEFLKYRENLSIKFEHTS